MAFTTRTITHTFQNPDGTPASATITFSLSKRITNGTTTLVPGEITATLDGSGNLSQALTSNVDAATNPTDSQWRVDIRMATPGAPVTEGPFWIVVPVGPGSTDLGSLLPSATTGG